MAIQTAQALDRLSATGVAKSNKSIDKTLIMAIMAGAYIGFAAMLATLSLTGWYIDGHAVFYGPSKILFGAVFSVGLMLVLIPGGELFTGNILLSISLVRGEIRLGQLARNWTLVWLGNFIGALVLAWLIAGPGQMLGGSVGETAMKVAEGKASLPWPALLVRSILANWIVCLAVLMAASSDSMSGKILAIFFPIMGFAAAGFEHSIANIYFIPAGLIVKSFHQAAGHFPDLTVANAVKNILITTVGNIIGGAFLVGGAYGLVHRPNT